MKQLRPHQRHMLDLIGQHDERHLLIQAPTGFGKSVLMAHQIANLPGRTLVMAPKRKLVRQLYETFTRNNLDVATVNKGAKTSQVILTTYQSANSRLKKDSEYFGDIDNIIIDEVHQAFNMPPRAGIKHIYDRFYHNARWYGYSATPIDMKGRRMEGWEATVGHPYDTAWLIEHGWLARYKYFTRPAIDTSDLEVQRTGDYKIDDVQNVAMQPVAIESTVKWWRHFTDDGRKKNMVFAATIEHAKLLAEAFEVPCAVVHSKMSEKEQDEEFDRFANNETTTLISVSMLTEGFDDPSVEVAVYARPTASVKLALQMAGRVLRQGPGGDKEALIVDLAGVYASTGILPDMQIDWNKPTVMVEPTKMLCIYCGNEFVKNENLHKKKKKKLVYKCPHCGAKNKVDKIKHNRSDKPKQYLKVDTVEEVKSLVDLETLDPWPVYRYTKFVNDLIKTFTLKYKDGNWSWAKKIAARCLAKDKGSFIRIVRGPFAQKRKWEMIMDIYSTNDKDRK